MRIVYLRCDGVPFTLANEFHESSMTGDVRYLCLTDDIFRHPKQGECQVQLSTRQGVWLVVRL